MFQDILGNKLVTSPFEEGEVMLPSPNQLKYKIIIKNKKLPEAEGLLTSTGRDDDGDSDFEDERFNNEISSGNWTRAISFFCDSSQLNY